MSYPGHSLGRGLTPLQRSSRCILQPQPTVQFADRVKLYIKWFHKAANIHKIGRLRNTASVFDIPCLLADRETHFYKKKCHHSQIMLNSHNQKHHTVKKKKFKKEKIVINRKNAFFRMIWLVMFLLDCFICFTLSFQKILYIYFC